MTTLTMANYLSFNHIIFCLEKSSNSDHLQRGVYI